MRLDELFELCHKRIENLFHIYLNQPNYPDKKLKQAMSYAVQNGGKRIRPLLVYITGYIFNVNWNNLDAAACAIELIHAYSLTHDDLPAMDNADLRRGKPSCHKKFDEATAILAGDALQPLAFSILANHPSDLTSKQRLEMINVLSDASGANGMAAGQSLDLAGVDSLDMLDKMYQLKTGALLTASIKLGLIANHNENTIISNSLIKYIENIGLAFQIQDDLLDVINDSFITGKPQGLDALNNKITYPTLLGTENTSKKIEELFSIALQAIEALEEKAEILRELAYYLLQRRK